MARELVWICCEFRQSVGATEAGVSSHSHHHHHVKNIHLQYVVGLVTTDDLSSSLIVSLQKNTPLLSM